MNQDVFRSILAMDSYNRGYGDVTVTVHLFIKTRRYGDSAPIYQN
jgi:hypothetical protein